jgi:hypothetical protein
MTSNTIHKWAVSNTKFLPLEESNHTFSLPDLATQIQSFISTPAPKHQPKETLFIVSFGFWDIYDFARLDYAMSLNVTDTSINFLFEQLDILYNHFTKNLLPSEPLSDKSTNTTQRNSKGAQFRVIMPRLFDPTLLPGWLSHRPTPSAPSSVAEQHKNAVYLTDRWNQQFENKMGSWINEVPSTSQPEKKEEQEEPRADVRENEDSFIQVDHSRDPAQQNAEKTQDSSEGNDEDGMVQKDIFYFDIPRLLLDLILEHQLEDEGLSDASGLGTGESPFESVYLPCVREAEEDDTDGFVDLNGLLVCKEPEEYLWWDAWSVGGVVKKVIGGQVATLVSEGKSLRAAWKSLHDNIGH